MNTFSTSVAALAAVLLADTAAADRYVSRDLDYGSGAGGAVQPGDLVYSTLQAAVAAAAAGDTVWVKDGFVCDTGATMYGMSNRVHITKALTIRSQSGSWEGGAAIVGAPDPTTGGNGDYATRCVNVTATGVTLIGLRLENGYVKSGNSGGGLFSQGKRPRLVNCRVEGCKGTAVVGTNGNLTEVVDCIVANNTRGLSYCMATNALISGNTAGDAWAGAGNSVLTDCRIVDNVVSNTEATYCRGGGMGSCYATNCLVAGNVVFSGNSNIAYSRGGAAWTSWLTGCVVSNNWARGLGGGLSGCTEAIGCTFVGNTTKSSGGAINMSSGGVISNCTFIGNVAAGGGGGVHCDANDPILIHGCAFTGNQAGGLGGAVLFYGSGSRATPGELTGSAIVGNTAKTGGGGIAGSWPSAFSVRNCLVASNDVSVSNEGGAGIYSAYVEDTLIEGNKILTRSNGSGGGTRDCVLYRCVVRGNDGLGNTGGCSGGSLTNCVVCGNYSTNATLNEMAGSGGGISSAIAVGCVISNNHANWRGGGISGGTSYSCLVVGNTLVGTAASGGAACWGGNLYNCTIVGNATKTGPKGFFYCSNVANTISWGNTGSSADEGATTVSNTCVAKLASSVSVKSGVISSDPLFRATSGEQAYHISGRSPCRKSGAVLEWLSDTRGPRALDLAGRPLAPEGAAPDMGCYAYDPIGFRLLVR